MNRRIGMILLAAGASTRMGRPKQTLLFENEPLVRRVARIAREAGCAPVVVVLGAHAPAVTEALSGMPVVLALNDGAWEQGMGSSIRTGMEHLLCAAETPLQAAIVSLCDQPLQTPEVLTALMDRFAQTDSPIVGSLYGDTVGPPALFAARLFPDLCALPAQAGARQWIQSRRGEIATVPFPGGAHDIDTPLDYDRLLS